MRHYPNIFWRYLRKQGSGGFTLAELLIVVAIVGVLVAIAIPVFTAQLESAKEATCLANRRSMYAEVVTTAMDTEKEKETFDKMEPNRRSKGYTCPDDGKWSWNETTRSITCDKHPGEDGGSSFDEGMISDIASIFGDGSWFTITDSDGNKLGSDAGARKEYAKKKGLTTWPEVKGTDGTSYYLQFKSYDKGTSSLFLYAGTNSDPYAKSNQDPWRARYICDTQGLCGEKGAWYELPSVTGLWQNNKTSCAEVIKKGTKVNLVGDKFEKA